MKANILLLSCVLAAGASAQPPTLPLPSTRSSATDNLLSQAARGVGVKQCLPAIERLSTLTLSGSTAHDVLVDWDRVRPDAGPFFSVVGVAAGKQSFAATITAVPGGNGACTVSAERISVAPYTCDSVASVELKGYARSRLLPTFTVYTAAADPGASVSLIDSPPGCLIIRRHVQYGWQDPGSLPARR